MPLVKTAEHFLLRSVYSVPYNPAKVFGLKFILGVCLGLSLFGNAYSIARPHLRTKLQGLKNVCSSFAKKLKHLDVF